MCCFREGSSGKCQCWAGTQNPLVSMAANYWMMKLHRSSLSFAYSRVHITVRYDWIQLFRSLKYEKGKSGFAHKARWWVLTSKVRQSLRHYEAAAPCSATYLPCLAVEIHAGFNQTSWQCLTNAVWAALGRVRQAVDTQSRAGNNSNTLPVPPGGKRELLPAGRTLLLMNNSSSG